MRTLYSWLIRAAAPLAFAQVLYRGLSDRGYWQGLSERFGFGPNSSKASIWLHAVSLGEMSAAIPLARALAARHPGFALVVTTATPAGRTRAQELSADIRYLPYDTPGSVKRFLSRIRPHVAIIMETELWPNLFNECERRKVPVFLASARLSAKSVSRYRYFGNLFAKVLTANVTIAAQSEEDAARFEAIGAAAKPHVVGNVKFDLQLDSGLIQLGQNVRAAFGDARAVWVAGSTHAREEEQLLDAHASLLARTPDVLLLLAPRHRDRFAAVADLLTQRGITFARRSKMASGADPEAGLNGVSVILIDTIGELAMLYASGDVAFVGGSLVPIGGHNLLEPAALGVPVLTGPSHFNGKEIARLLLRRGAAIEVNGSKELAQMLARLFAEPAERQRIGRIGVEIVAANRGSLARLLALIEPSLRS